MDMGLLLKIVSHLRLIVMTVEDLEHGVSDLIHKAPAGADFDKALADVLAIFATGIIEIPGVSQDQINQVLGALKPPVAG